MFKIKNKAIAIFGIGSYILSVITSATDLDGNLKSPVFLIFVSGITTVFFTIIAVIRLWKGVRYISVILVSSSILLFVLETVQTTVSLSYGSLTTILLNIVKVIHFVTFTWVIIILYKSKE